MRAVTRDHVVAATHLVLGPSNFLVIRLPDNWDLRIGRQPADVDYTFAYDGIRWAQQGRATGAASYALGFANLGLLGTKRYSILHVAYRCAETQRVVDLRFMHKGDLEVLQGLLPSLEGTRCH